MQSLRSQQVSQTNQSNKIRSPVLKIGRAFLIQQTIPMEENQIIKSLADTFTDKALYEITVPVRCLPPILELVVPKRTILDKILRRPMPVPTPVPAPETSRTLTFYPSVVANQYRIAGECALLPETIWQDQSMNIPLLPEHQKRMVYIVAAALQNNHLEPEPELIAFLTNNLTGEQLRDALIASFQTLNMEAFTDTIVLMKGAVNILKASPNDGSELIASHTEI